MRILHGAVFARLRSCVMLSQVTMRTMIDARRKALVRHMVFE